MIGNPVEIDIAEICSQYGGRLFQAAYGITRDYHRAEDVVQDTLVKAYLKKDTIHDLDKVGSWLCTIATRTAIDYVRKEKRNNEIFLENSMLDCYNKNIKSSHNVEKEVELSFLQEEIQQGIKSLSNDQRNAILLKIDEGLKEHEIAETLNIKQGTVKTNIYRARKQLRTMLAAESLA